MINTAHASSDAWKTSKIIVVSRRVGVANSNLNSFDYNQNFGKGGISWNLNSVRFGIKVEFTSLL